MTYDRRILELTLESVQVCNTGETPSKDGKHVVVAGLLWPRPGIADKTTFKTVDLVKKRVSLAESPWPARALFKETVQGPFGIELGVSTRVTDAWLNGFVRFLGEVFFRVAGVEAGSLVGNSLASGLVKAPFKHLGNTAGKKAGDVDVVASGTLDLVADENWPAGEVRTLTVPLCTPKPIACVERRRSHGELKTRKRTVMKKGEPNGEATLCARLYD